MGTKVLEMDREELKEEIMREVENYFNEKLYDSPVFKLSERIIKVEEDIGLLSFTLMPGGAFPIGESTSCFKFGVGAGLSTGLNLASPFHCFHSRRI